MHQKKRKRERKSNVSATYGGPLQYHKLKGYFKISVNDQNIGNDEN